MTPDARALSSRVAVLARGAALAALLLGVQTALAFLPNIELGSLLVMLFALALPLRQVLPILYAFAALEGLVYGFGMWWVSYLYVWPLLALCARALRGCRSALPFALLSGGFGLLFGALCAIPYAVAGGFAAGFAYWISGIPFDLAHCAGNFVAALALFSPLRRVLARLTGGGLPASP